MKNLIIIVSLAIFPLTAQIKPDTLFFDPTTGNYVIKYVGDEDTLVTVIFEPATKINPLVDAEVSLSGQGDTLIYHYKVTNQKNGKQRLQYFELEYSADFVDVTQNRWTGRKIKRPVLEGNRISNVETNRYFWAGGIGIGLGIVAEGFRIKSVGLPAIVNAYFQGNVPMTPFPDGGPPPELDRQIAKLEIFPANRVIRKTVAPVLPPEPFIPLAFLDTLLSYTRQSAALGWLAPPGQGRDRDEDSDEDEKPEHGLVRNIEQRLNKAKRELQRQDSVKARRELEKLVKKVERVWKRSQDEEKRGRNQRMTSEAYALLKYNTEYLIDRLPKKKGEKDDDDKEDR